MKILAIETSCDETAVAIVTDGKSILTNIVASSVDLQKKYGGIVPEVAARKQVEFMVPVLHEAMTGFTEDDIDAIAVTVGPGLIGSLLVGVETAKTLAFAWNKPLIPVNHVLAHIYAVFLFEPNLQPIRFPAIALVVSGGHTELYFMENEKTLKWLGGTLDDAAGEAFDKTARLLGLPYPGGPEIEKAANQFKAESLKFKVKLPRPMFSGETLNFSFSGLKTAVLREWKKLTNSQPTTHNLQLISAFAHEIQEAITDVLVSKTLSAAHIYQAKSIIVSGGVAANQRLKDKFNLQLTTYNLQLLVPPPKLCVDSATYIAAYAFYHHHPVTRQSIDAIPNLSVEI
ncbi:tRNA (adenosine(37)-N6)-threonylcarbamoyltransferase complex transferase subunit TsaD [Candidatus Gottesmanbacteria bacterium]|nr:tRNA (adenosine(37)-N6)-threonylcarbamoyltransferase complex transferase subunit TsaD [Candidatus Gottesmanbacteria bacterium]